MEDKTIESIIMELLVGGGNARSLALEALHAAREEDFEKADTFFKECDEALLGIHQIQTELIQKEAGGQHMEVQLLMVHAQDHLMNAMTVRDLSGEIVEILRKNAK